MKKLMTLVLLLAIGSMSYAQKNELKAIEKALKNVNFSDAKAAVSTAEALIDNMDGKSKAKFYFLKAQALYANGAGTDANIDEAIVTLDKLKTLESSMGKLKYTDQANDMKSKMYNTFITKANDAFKSNDYEGAAARFEKIYRVSPKDTSYLYSAAYSSVRAEDYDSALKYYIELEDLGYTGIAMNYYATNLETGEEDFYGDNKSGRDFAVKIKTHDKPRDSKAESRRSEIVKNIALIYVSQGENEKALGAIADAKAENPEDYNLILSEGNVYLKLDNKEKASELYKEALSMDPENPDLNYNVGVLAMSAGQFDDAKSYFNKALKLKPDHADAALNLSSIQVNIGNAMNDEMNALGNSAADNKRYEEIRVEKKAIFSEGAAILENYLNVNPLSKNLDILTQLKNIYGALNEGEKYKAMKAKIENIESAGN
ncbi:tetratricopeptide repeat protein [uncultured Winogradskyella sp.]|uniref:tetratricopeptide repeat protein n=1 Tax=Winogradskyella sp. 4-2091 TaxID=3381659 RepID=UPI00262DA716|nr:tetratricopeptide repeat protein [uncultured Winogradskyella sp.]